MIKATSIILIFTVIVAWLLYLFPKQMISPGDLLAKHQHLEDNCFDCHNTFLGATGEKCVECHDPVKIGINTINSQQKHYLVFHGKLGENSCLSCHQEHQGALAAKQTLQFSHQLLGIKNQSNCLDCHQAPNDAIHQQSGQQCDRCHETARWTSAEYNHDGNFKFNSDHPADCTNCHPNSDYQTYTCYGCHEHTQQKIAREHSQEGIQNYQDCVECHASGDGHDIRESKRSENRGSETTSEDIRKLNKNSRRALERPHKSRNHSDKDDDKKSNHKSYDD